jgi:anti-anti-sigma factor
MSPPDRFPRSKNFLTDDEDRHRLTVDLRAERGLMELLFTSHENIPVLQVTGDIDMATAPGFDAALEKHSDGFRSPLLIDLTGCPFMDSGALNVLLQAVRRLAGPAWLGVVGANTNLLRVFEIVALTSDPRFRVLKDLSEVAV